MSFKKILGTIIVALGFAFPSMAQEAPKDTVMVDEQKKSELSISKADYDKMVNDGLIAGKKPKKKADLSLGIYHDLGFDDKGTLKTAIALQQVIDVAVANNKSVGTILREITSYQPNVAFSMLAMPYFRHKNKQIGVEAMGTFVPNKKPTFMVGVWGAISFPLNEKHTFTIITDFANTFIGKGVLSSGTRLMLARKLGDGKTVYGFLQPSVSKTIGEKGVHPGITTRVGFNF